MRKTGIIMMAVLLFVLPCPQAFADDKPGSYYEDVYAKKYLKELPNGIPDYTKERNQALLDLPIAVGIGNFYFIVSRIEQTIKFLCAIFCFLCIVFSVFKLWAGTIEVKKMFVDVIYKCVICMMFLLYFVPATNFVLDLATVFGSRIAGGYQKVDNTYAHIYKVLSDNIEIGLKDILKAYLDNAGVADDGVKYLDVSVIKQLQSVGASESDIKQWAAQNGVQFAEARWTVEYDTLGNEYARHLDGWFNEKGDKLTVTKPFLFFWERKTDLNLGSVTNKANKIVEKELNAKEQRTWVVKLNALMEVMTAAKIDSPEVMENDGGTDKVISEAEKTVKSVFYTPYLVDKNDKFTNFFAPGAILKTVTVMSDVVAYATSSDLDEKGKYHAVEFNPKGVWTFPGMVKALTAFIYKLLACVAAILIMVEYTMTILEFYLVRALAMFLIPMFFLDVTKPFAQNLMRILISYFFKILTVILTCFFALGMFLDTQLFVMQYANDLSSTLTLIMYVSTIMMGVVFVMSSGKIAGVVLSGNPSMGMGDVAHAVRSGMQAAHTAGHVARSAVAGGKAAVSMGQAGVRGMMSAGAVMGAGLDAASDTVASLNGDKSYAGGSGRTIAAGAGAFMSTVGAAMKQGAADKGYKFLTGKERQHLDADGRGTDNRFIGLGEKTENESGGMHSDTGRQNATYGDMKRGADSVAGQKKKNAVEWAKKKKKQDGLAAAGNGADYAADMNPGNPQDVYEVLNSMTNNYLGN